MDVKTKSKIRSKRISKMETKENIEEKSSKEEILETSENEKEEKKTKSRHSRTWTTEEGSESKAKRRKTSTEDTPRALRHKKRSEEKEKKEKDKSRDEPSIELENEEAVTTPRLHKSKHRRPNSRSAFLERRSNLNLEESTASSQISQDEQFARRLQDQELHRSHPPFFGSHPTTFFTIPNDSGNTFMPHFPAPSFQWRERNHFHSNGPPASIAHSLATSSADHLYTLVRSLQGGSTSRNTLALTLSLMNRDFTDEDYEILLRLDEEGNPYKAAPKETIESLPTRKITSLELANMKKEKIQCSICLEDFVVGSEVRTLPCTHFFHLSCIDTWLKVNKTCPIDKKDVTD